MMNEYREFHRNPLNLLIHITTVPLFLLSVLGAMVAPFTAYWAGLWSASVALGVYSLLLQRFGHSLEGAKPGSAGGTASKAYRLVVEQFVTFPRFVLSGGWASNWRQAPRLVIGHRRTRFRAKK